MLLRSSAAKKLINTKGSLEVPSELLASQAALLAYKPKYNKISYRSTNPYNKRWEFKWKHAYYTYPRDGDDHMRVKKPEDSHDTEHIYGAWIKDFL